MTTYACQPDAGLVRDDLAVHVVARKALLADQALCGAGRICERLAGHFDPDDWLACSACRDLAVTRAR